MNRINLSDGRMILTITAPDGHQDTYRSARPDGFIEADLDYARTLNPNTGLTEGQIKRTWLHYVGGRPFFVHVNTGPPTWWLPRVEVKRGKVMVGWLRGSVALSWSTK